MLATVSVGATYQGPGGTDGWTKVHEHEKGGRMNMRQANSKRGHESKSSDLQDEWRQSVDQELRTGLEEGCIAPARPALQNGGRNAGLRAERGRTRGSGSVVQSCQSRVKKCRATSRTGAGDRATRSKRALERLKSARGEVHTHRGG